MKRSWMVIAAVILAAVAAGAIWAFSPAQPVQAARVMRGLMREFVDERGKTRLPETHLVTMPFSGRIEAITLEVGDRIEAGQVVARVSTRDLENEIAEARAAVERLEASLIETADTSVEQTTREQAQLTAESMTSTVAASEAKLRADQSRIEYAETFLGRVQRAFESGAQNEDELAKARLSVIESEVDYREDALNTESLKTMKLAIDLLPKIAQEYIERKSLTGNVLEKEKQEAEVRLRQAELRRERGVMASAVDGVVLERPIQNEQFLEAGTVLLEIGQLDQLEVETDVLSEDVVRVRRGDAATIYGPALGADVETGVPGEVHRVSPAGFTKISSLGVEQQRVTVIVRFAADELAKLRARQDLGVDYRVRVRIFTATKDDALTIPRSAMFRRADRGWAVFVVRGGRVAQQPIDVGLLNDDLAEVQSGLEEGDIVVLAPESSLEHGARVQPLIRE